MRYLVVLLLLSGCAQTYWARDTDNTEQAFNMDKGMCQAQAFGVPGMYPMQVTMVYNACMQGKGWYTVRK